MIRHSLSPGSGVNGRESELKQQTLRRDQASNLRKGVGPRHYSCGAITRWRQCFISLGTGGRLRLLPMYGLHLDVDVDADGHVHVHRAAYIHVVIKVNPSAQSCWFAFALDTTLDILGDRCFTDED